jgi:radical SAM protein with 4Fe4S-binding SPASM domain
VAGGFLKTQPIRKNILMWSKYLCTLNKEGVVAVFHELHPDPMFFQMEQWERIFSGTLVEDSFYQDFRRRKLIIDSLKDDEDEFKAASLKLEKKLNQPTILYLMTAQGCNFECRYCPVPETALKYGASLLSKENAFAGIDLWQEHLNEMFDSNHEYYVIFYGGEPLLNKDVIKQSLEYLQIKKEAGMLPAKLNMMIATNGALVDEEVINLCLQYNVSVAVGLDGPKTLNDTLKVDVEGRGTFDRIVAVIRKLVERGVQTYASASITPSNLEHVSDYGAFFKELGVEKFGLNFLKGKFLIKIVGESNLDDYYRKASKAIIEQSRRQADDGFEYQMQKKQIAFDQKDFFPVDCTCYGNQLVIQPDGQISNCPFYKAQLGNVCGVGKNFRIWNQPIVHEWRKRLPLFHSGIAKSMCGGGCAWSSIELKGDSTATDDSSKIFAEMVLEELIWSQYEKTKF